MKLLIVVLAGSALACSANSGTTDPRAEAYGYALDNIPCATGTDCCAVLYAYKHLRNWSFEQFFK